MGDQQEGEEQQLDSPTAALCPGGQSIPLVQLTFGGDCCDLTGSTGCCKPILHSGKGVCVCIEACSGLAEQNNFMETC